MPIAIGNGQAACVGASVGVAYSPNDAIEAGHLLKIADEAMYKHKVTGRGQAILG